MDRQPGYYWVKTHRGEWRIAEFNKHQDWVWESQYIRDGDFNPIEINETRIPSPDEKIYYVSVGGQRAAFLNEDSLREFMRLNKLTTITLEAALPELYTL